MSGSSNNPVQPEQGSGIVPIAGQNGWNEFNAVNDPASGKQVQNQGHAGDDWSDFEAVNDPASGKTVPNQGHAA